MASDQLRRDGLHHIAEVEGALLPRHLRVEHHLQQQVAEFVAQVDQVSALDRIRDLVGFLDRVGGDGSEGLLEIPRAAGTGRPERRHDFEQSGNVGRGGHWQLRIDADFIDRTTRKLPVVWCPFGSKTRRENFAFLFLFRVLKPGITLPSSSAPRPLRLGTGAGGCPASPALIW